MIGQHQTVQCVIGVPERKPGRKKDIEEKLVINFPDLLLNYLHIQESQQTLSWVSTENTTPKHITVKMWKIEGKNRNGSRRRARREQAHTLEYPQFST